MTPAEMDRAIKRIILDQSYRANVGHVGSCLSVSSIIAALYAPDGGVLRIETPDDPERDRFILSCGHKALAVYAALHLHGWISQAALDTFCQPGSKLLTHPSHEVPGIEYSTGSLGMGLSYACGEALSAKRAGSDRRVYCLLSDAELNEGSTWEAVMFAAHHRLDNLVVIVDANGQQALGKTADICNQGHIEAKFEAFGWHGYTVDSTRSDAYYIAACAHPDNYRTVFNVPKVIVTSTTFGAGVSFMENELAWHYKPMTDDEYAQAIAEVTA